MNRQIIQLFGLFAVLFALLVVFTSRWTVFEAQSLEENAANRRPLIEEQRIPRGIIYASDGRTRLAVNRGSGRGKNRIFTRFYPEGELFAHPIGYSFIRNGQRSLEKTRNEDLAGREDEFETLFAGLEGRDREGLDVVTNLDVQGTQAAIAGLAGRRGAVVALEPQTGKVRVMVAFPGLRPEPDHLRLRPHPAPEPAAQPLHRGALSAGLDVQGGHRRRGARQRQGHP